jgi:phage I-like protein
MKSQLNEELKKEQEKLNRMIQDAIDNGRLLQGDEDILKQSRKVDALLNRVRGQKDRGESR